MTKISQTIFTDANRVLSHIVFCEGIPVNQILTYLNLFVFLILFHLFINDLRF